MYDEAGIVKANWNKVFKNMVIRDKPQTAVEAKESIDSLPEVIERNRRRKSLRKSKHRQSVTKAFREQKTKKMDIQEEIKSVSDSEEEKASRKSRRKNYATVKSRSNYVERRETKIQDDTDGKAEKEIKEIKNDWENSVNRFNKFLEWS